MTALWQTPGFLRLTAERKLMVLYFLNGPQANKLGLYVVSFQQLASDMGMELDAAVTMAREVWRIGRWQFDDVRRLLWIPTWWQYHPCESDSKFRKLMVEFKGIVSSDLKARFLAQEQFLPESQRTILRQVAAGVSSKKRVVMVPTTESTDLFGGSITAAPGEPSALAHQVLIAWNTIVTAPIPQVSRLTNKLRDKIYARLCTFTNIDDYRAVFKMLNASPWFRGERGDVVAYKDWVGDLAWIMYDDDRFQKQLDKARTIRPDVPVTRLPTCRHAPACHSQAVCTSKTLKEMGV